MSFEFIATSRPVDRTAAEVMRPGEHYEPVKYLGDHVHSDVPIATRTFPGPREHDLKGVRQGSLVVQGYANEQSSNGTNGSQWVVRCDCSHYEIRRTKALKNPLNFEDRCSVCNDLAWVRKHSQRVRETHGQA